jgi:acyl carrier protein
MIYKKVYELIQGVVENLINSDSIDPIENFNEQTIILGNGSVLDSISFIVFITDVEDQLQEETGQELYLVLNQIDNFNVDNPNLTIEILSKYICLITE